MLSTANKKVHWAGATAICVAIAAAIVMLHDAIGAGAGRSARATDADGPGEGRELSCADRVHAEASPGARQSAECASDPVPSKDPSQDHPSLPPIMEEYELATWSVTVCYGSDGQGPFSSLLFGPGVDPETRARTALNLLRGAPPYTFEPGVSVLGGPPLSPDEHLLAVRRGVIADLLAFKEDGNARGGRRDWSGIDRLGLRRDFFDAVMDVLVSEPFNRNQERIVEVLWKLRKPDRELQFTDRVGRNTDPALRRLAIEMIRREGAPGAAEIDLVCQALSDSDPQVQFSACKAGCALGVHSERVYERAMELFDQGRIPQEQQYYLRLLIHARPHDKETSQRIQQALAAPAAGPDPLRWEVMVAVKGGVLKAGEYLDAVRAGLVHPDASVRKVAIDALGARGDPSDIELLTRSPASEPDEACREALTGAIENLRGSTASEK